MKYLLDAREMKACDTFTIQTMGVPSMVLMERAALAVVDEIEKYRKPCINKDRILVLSGSGNNGGDGFAAARLLLLKGMAADVYFAGEDSRMTEETAHQRKIFENYGGKISRNPDLSEYTILVDALFGIGLSRPISGKYAELIHDINESGLPVIAVDIPSGISADTGAVMGCAVRADLTVTFAFAKRGQILYPGTEYCGRLVIKDIGITAHGLAGRDGTAFFFEKEDLKGLPQRTGRSNKGTYGTVLLIAGTANMAGAALLGGRAAYRAGCGLVRIMSDEKNREIIQTALPEAVYLPLGDETALKSALAHVQAVGVGPGLGTGERALGILEQLLSVWDGPVVIDADGLNLLSGHPGLWENAKAQIIVTPHPGEMSRLAGRAVSQLLADIPGECTRYAAEKNIICVLKDARTAVSDGKKLYLNTSGANGMAAGGSGDVLTGVICSLIAQGMEAFEAACMGVYLHGLAGEAAAEKKGNRGMMAGELADAVADVPACRSI